MKITFEELKKLVTHYDVMIDDEWYFMSGVDYWGRIILCEKNDDGVWVYDGDCYIIRNIPEAIENVKDIRPHQPYTFKIGDKVRVRSGEAFTITNSYYHYQNNHIQYYFLDDNGVRYFPNELTPVFEGETKTVEDVLAKLSDEDKEIIKKVLNK